MSNRVFKIAAIVRNTLLEKMPSIPDWHAHACVITEVAMTKDLSIAKVFVTVGSGDTELVLAKLNKLAKRVAAMVANENSFRRAPSVRFLADESHAVSQELDTIRKILLQDEQ